MVNTGGGTLLIDPDNIEITTLPVTLVGASAITPDSIIASLATGNVILQTTNAATEAGTILVSGQVIYDSAFSLILMAEGDIAAKASIQNSNATGGDVVLVAGWDGTTAYDAATFDAADLATTTLFGNANNIPYNVSGTIVNASGSIGIGGNGRAGGVAIGSRQGATRTYSNALALVGSNNPDVSFQFALLGFNVTSDDPLTEIDGSIGVRAKGAVLLQSGLGLSDYAQIGHVGSNSFAEIAVDVDVNAAISVESSVAVVLNSVNSDLSSYTQIGHGSLDVGSFARTGGNRSGNITVVAADRIILDGSLGTLAWIGHGSGTPFARSNADVFIEANQFSSALAAGADGVISVEMLTADLVGGNVTVVSHSGILTLRGSTENSECSCNDVTSDHDLLVEASDITLDTSFRFSNLGTGDVILAAAPGGVFQNNTGADPFALTGGRWLIFSARPDGNVGDIGTLSAGFIAYSTAFDAANPQPGSLPGGNGLVYAVTPVVTVGPATVTYGAALVPPGITVTVGGVGVSAAAFGFDAGTARIDPAQVVFSADGFVNAGFYAAGLTTDITATGTAPVTGLSLVAGALAVDPATIVVTLADQTKTYDGAAYGGLVTFTGFVGTDTAGLITGGPGFSYSGGPDTGGFNAGSYVVNASGTTEASGNYVFNQTDVAKLQINQAVLSVGLTGDLTKSYDGTTVATLNPGNYVLTGFVAGEGAIVTQTSGTYASKDAGPGNLVTALLASGDFAASGATLLSNYVLPVAAVAVAVGDGVIDQVVLTAAIIGDPNKPFDGTTLASLTDANFFLSGFVAGEGATVTQTAGTYASAVGGSGIPITAALAAGDFSAFAGTNLGNYILPVSASGPGSIGNQPQPFVDVPLTRGLDGFDTTPLGDPAGPALGLELISTETTQRIIDEINAGSAFCKQLLHQEYMIDCLSDRLQSVADGLSAVGEYSEVRRALEDAAQKLHALAVDNASVDLAQQVARTTGKGGRTSSRPLTAVSAANLAGVNAQATAIINSTELVLLRSSANSERRRVAFAQVAQVVDSTKVLLRSSS